MYGTADYEGGFQDARLAFSEKSIRQGFIRKVYGILTVQLLITIAFIAIFLFGDGVKEYAKNHIEMWAIAFVLVFIVMIVFVCFTEARRQWPLNIILLCVFTLCQGFLLGSVSATYDADAVIMAVGITTAVCLGLTIFALQTKWDFTILRGLMLSLLISLIFFGILAGALSYRAADVAYAWLGAAIFSIYLVIDTQLLMGGNHRYAITPEEYIFAALNLYMDIINLFLMVLRLVGRNH